MIVRENSTLGMNSRQKYQSIYPRLIYILYFLFALYMVLPIIDIPLLGLSLSAPIFFVIAVHVLLKTPSSRFRIYRRWIILAMWIWVGIFTATVFNGLLSGGVNITQGGILTVIRYAYWLLVFVVTAYFTSKVKILQQTASLLGWGILALALLRLGEVVLYGNIGAQSGTHLLFQNTYGFLFSTFSPFLLVFLFKTRGVKWLLAAIGNLLLWGAMLVNGSRGSWIAIVVGAIVCLALLAWSRPRLFIGLLFSIFLLAGIAQMTLTASPEFSRVIENRFGTFKSLDKDKSYLTRQLMNQKSLQLFISSPLIGIGAARFRLESVQLDIPKLLSGRSAEYLNTISSHNSYLGFLAENGLFGAVPFSLLFISLAVQGLQRVLNWTRRGQYWALAILLSFIQMSAHMWGIASLTNTGNWFIYGLVVAMITAERTNNEEAMCYA